MRKAGLGQPALRGKEYLVAVRPFGRGLLAETLHYAGEVRKPDSFFAETPAGKSDKDLLDVAAALIEKKTSRFDVTAFKDHYRAALRELIARKMKAGGRKITVEEDERPSGGDVIDLVSALRKPLAGDRAPAASRKPATHKAAGRSPARRKAS